MFARISRFKKKLFLINYRKTVENFPIQFNPHVKNDTGITTHHIYKETSKSPKRKNISKTIF